MSRLSGAFWFMLVVATGMTNFLVKQTVQNLDDQLTQVRRKTAEDQKKIHDLTADWTFLNQPELLADLNNRYVHLASMSAKQVVANLDAIPMRPAGPPPEDNMPPMAAVAAPVAPPAPVMVPAPVASAPPIPVEAAAASPPAAPQATPARATIAAASTPGPSHAPATPLSLISTAHASTPAPPANPPRAQPAAPAASLDAIFSQVAGNR